MKPLAPIDGNGSDITPTMGCTVVTCPVTQQDYCAAPATGDAFFCSPLVAASVTPTSEVAPTVMTGKFGAL